MVKRLKNDGTFESVYPLQTATPNKAVYIDLDEGKFLAVVGAAGTTGMVSRMIQGAIDASFQPRAIGSGVLPRSHPWCR